MTPSISKHGKQCKQLAYCHYLPSVLWCCWLGDRKDSRPVKTEWWGAGVVVCLKQGADLHTAQLMPLPLTVSCFSEIQTCFTSLVPAHPGSPGKGPLNVCVCYYHDKRRTLWVVLGEVLHGDTFAEILQLLQALLRLQDLRELQLQVSTHTHTRTRQLTCNGRHLQLMLAAMEQ